MENSMTISEYKETLRNENNLPTNFHIDISNLSTYKKWVNQFNEIAENVKMEGTEKQVAWARKIKSDLIQQSVFSILTVIASSATKLSTNEINVNDDIFKLGWSDLNKIAKMSNSTQLIEIRDNQVNLKMVVAQANLSKR